MSFEAPRRSASPPTSTSIPVISTGNPYEALATEQVDDDDSDDDGSDLPDLVDDPLPKSSAPSEPQPPVSPRAFSPATSPSAEPISPLTTANSADPVPPDSSSASLPPLPQSDDSDDDYHSLPPSPRRALTPPPPPPPPPAAKKARPPAPPPSRVSTCEQIPTKKAVESRDQQRGGRSHIKTSAPSHTPPFDPPDEPVSLQEALSGPDAPHWRGAVEREMAAHLKNDTFTIVPRPRDRNVISTKFVWKLKNADTADPIYKARLVIYGFSQHPGEDYDETFSPIPKATTV